MKCQKICLDSQKHAIGFYEKLGFKNVGVRKNFYDQPKEDGIIYTKFLGANK